MTTTAPEPPDGRRTWVLDRTPPPRDVPVLDASQQAVVDHPGGPLLVLAGPGTGKTTTLVEAVAERVRRGLRPDQVLVLTFSRKAADELRERVAGRLEVAAGAASVEPAAWTFHAWCLALLRDARLAGAATPRLLSGPERLVRVRELLAGQTAGAGTVRWPAALAVAVRTRGFAAELAALLDRVRERGLEPSDVAAIARSRGRADWAAAAAFYAEYVDVLGLAGELDYGELARQALRLLEDSPGLLGELRQRYRAVFVDEYQDTDPAQERLLTLLAGGGGDLVVVGDPDQSVYAFRGAEVGCLLRFPERFPRADGTPAPTLALSVSRRAGATLLDLSRRVVAKVPAPGLAVESVRAHRALVPAAGRPAGAAEVRIYATAADQAAGISDVLRRAHLEDGRSWSAMAVLVRSGRSTLPVLRRALVAAGVPVAVAADEIPVARDPAVTPFLLALRVADQQHRAATDPAAGVPALTEEAARDLLLSPLGRATPAGLRRLARGLRLHDRRSRAADPARGPDVDGVSARVPRPSSELVRSAVATPGLLLELPDAESRWAEPVYRLASSLAAARSVLSCGGGADEALWSLWEGSRSAQRLAAASAAGGRAGRAADRDLDAVVALFEEVARLLDRVPRMGVAGLLDTLGAQEIPSGDRAEGRPGSADAVRLLTAHRAKGLEWDIVVVVGVQDARWPDLRRRGSVLQADLLTADDTVLPPTATAALVDERRLFYVAATRARERLVITAIDSPHDDGERPSRFLEETGLPVPAVPTRPAPVLAADALAGRLRHALLDPATPATDRTAAASALRRLSEYVPAADPRRWWGMLDWTPGAQPVRPAGEPVLLSASAVSAYEECPLAAFFGREVRATPTSTAAQGSGQAVHALARLVADGAVPPDVDALIARLDDVWEGLGFEAPWYAAVERGVAREALSAFLCWQGSTQRELVAAEHAIDVAWTGSTDEGTPLAARLRGSIDRIERDAAGAVHVVDLKTSKNAPSSTEVATHPQLGVYQVAVREGALGAPAALGGAELVQLRDRTTAGARTQRQDALPPGLSWVDRMLIRVVGALVAEQFPARVSKRCDRCAFRGSCPAQDAGGQVVP